MQPAPTPILAPLLQQWQVWQYAQSLSVRTVNERVGVLHRISQKMRIEPRDLQVQHIAEWLSHDSWSARTRWTYHQCLTAWFVWLQKQGYRSDNPMVMIGKPRRPRCVPHPISNNDLVRLLNTPMRRRSLAMIHLAAFQGFRASEIAKVKGEDFDLAERTVTVTGKGNVTAILPVHHRVVEIAHVMPKRGYWFPGPVDGHQRRESISGTIKDVMVRAGVPGSAHALRHWFGTALVEADVDLRTVQTLMRHQSLSTTAIYTQITAARQDQGIQRLNPLAGAVHPTSS